MSRRLVAAGIVACLPAFGACGSDARSAAPPHAVQVRAAGCTAVDTLATGSVVGSGLVLTVAHALHGADAVTVDGQPARVVALDDRLDAALLSVVAGTAADDDVRLADRTSAGDARVVRTGGASSTHVSRVVDAVVDADVDADAGVVHRRVLELDLSLESGDSGAPVVDRHARLIGMVFATSREGDRSYAVAIDELAPFVAAAATAGPDAPAVDLGACD